MQTELDAAQMNVAVVVSPIRERHAPTIYKRTRMGESIIYALLVICGAISIFTTIGIAVVLGEEAIRFFVENSFSVVEFLTTIQWRPTAGQIGILPLLNATLMTTVIAMLVALPLGVGAAIYLSEYAPERVRATLKPVLEILAGIPTVVYGYFALTFMTPLLRGMIGGDTVEFFNTASAGLVMGIMILPTISSISEDALSAVPRSLREASYGLGATRFETIIKVVLPASLSGILAALILGISRGVGETMIVALAAGARPLFTLNPFVGAETMTGHIVRISQGDLQTPVQYSSLFAIGLALFLVTLVLNLISRAVSNRFREAYE